MVNPVEDDDAELVAGYVSLRHTITAIARTSMAYSNIRRIWWPLAHLDLPTHWMLNAAVLANRPGELVTLGAASARLTDREERVFLVDPPARPRPLLLALIVLNMIFLYATPLLIIVASTSRPALLVDVDEVDETCPVHACVSDDRALSLCNRRSLNSTRYGTAFSRSTDTSTPCRCNSAHSHCHGCCSSVSSSSGSTVVRTPDSMLSAVRCD